MDAYDLMGDKFYPGSPPPTDGHMKQGETAKLQAENARLRALLTQAREALEAVEFYPDPFEEKMICPWCHKIEGHHADCPRQRALAALKDIA